MPSLRDVIRHVPGSSLKVLCIPNNYWAHVTELSKMSAFTAEGFIHLTVTASQEDGVEPKKNIPSLGVKLPPSYSAPRISGEMS